MVKQVEAAAVSKSGDEHWDAQIFHKLLEAVLSDR